MKDYLLIPLRQRAAMRKADTCGNFHNYPDAVGGIRTRDGKGSRFSPVAGKYSTPVCHLTEEEADYLRFVGKAHSLLSRIDHTGWYVDNQYGETTVGVVYRLPGDRFLAGCSDPWNCDKAGRGPCSISGEVFDTPEEAAREADSLAESYAEFCREDDAKQTADGRIETAKEEIGNLRDEIRELIAGIRESTLAPAVCERMRRDIRKLRADMAGQGELIRKWTANYWDAVQS